MLIYNTSRRHRLLENTALRHAKSDHINVWESDTFKHPLTHISSIPKGGVEWLLVMLEQVLDICKAFNLEDLRFLLDDLPETNRQIDLTYICMSLP